MNSKAKQVSRYLFILISFLFLSGVLVGQEKNGPIPSDCEKTLESVAWMPDGTEPVNAQQLNIWYDFARDPYNKGVHGSKEPHWLREAVRYYWLVVLNDQVGTFKIAFSKLADSYMRLNEPDSALMAVYLGLSKFKDYQTMHYYGAQVHQAQGNNACAATHYQILINGQKKDDPQHLTYLGILAKLYDEIDDERAIDIQQQVVELDPGNAEAGAYLARLLENYGHDPFKALQKAYESDTTQVSMARRFGKTAYESGFYKESLRAFRAVLQQEKGDVEALNYMARSYEGLNQLNNARKAYRTILNTNPDNQNALCAMSSLEARKGNFTSAINYLHKARKVDPANGLIYMISGEVYEQAVSTCSNDRQKSGFSYDDKLVYELARKAYRKAASDSRYKTAANRRYEQLAPFVRSKEDKFMHSDRNAITAPCYKWINQSTIL